MNLSCFYLGCCAGVFSALTACGNTSDVNKAMVYRPQSAALGEVAAVAGSDGSAESSIEGAWYGPYLRAGTTCETPFLAVERSDGQAVDLYYDGGCR
jgi:hypothetical protein